MSSLPRYDAENYGTVAHVAKKMAEAHAQTIVERSMPIRARRYELDERLGNIVWMLVTEASRLTATSVAQSVELVAAVRNVTMSGIEFESQKSKFGTLSEEARAAWVTFEEAKWEVVRLLVASHQDHGDVGLLLAAKCKIQGEIELLKNEKES